jgi:hypothetical protein
MNHVIAPQPRDERGFLLPGARLNPSGRPTSEIAAARQKYGGKNALKYFERLDKLTHSKNESIALQATREILDRLIGKPVAVVESTHTRYDMGAMYLEALRKANEPRPIDADAILTKPEPDAGKP